MQLKQNENEESIFKTFENTLPVNWYKYEDALLHLKKRDAKNVDNDIEKYCRLVSSANSFIEESKEETNKKIEEKISEVYPDGRENEDSD